MSFTWVVLAVVLLFVVWYLLHSLRLVRKNEASVYLGELWVQLANDVTFRVKNGRDPDRTHYLEEASRKHEDLREQLRNYGTISLATGVGGTMLALALYLLFSGTETGAGDVSRLPEMLYEMGLALIASFTGVSGNLVILWVLLPLANRRFNPGLDDFLARLRAVEINERKQLGPRNQLRIEGAGSQLDEEVIGAVSQLPSALEKIGNAADVFSNSTSILHEDAASLTSASTALTKGVLGLRQVPDELDSGIGKTLAGLQENADALGNALAGANSRFSQLAERLVETGEQITAAADFLPQRVSAALNDSAESFHLELNKKLDLQLDRLGDAILEAGSQHREAADQFKSTGDRLGAALTRLPEQVALEVMKSGETLQRSVGDAINPHIAQFRDGVSEGLDKAAKWQQASQKQLDDLKTGMAKVNKSIASLPGQLDEGIKNASGRLGRAFGNEARDFLLDHAKVLQSNLEKLQKELMRHENRLLEKSIENLQVVSQELINDTVRNLSRTSDRLAEVIEKFPEHLKAANERIDLFEANLTTVVNQTKENSTALRSAHERTDKMLEKVAMSASGLSNVIQKLAMTLARPPFWSRWWRGVFGSRQKAASGENAD